LNGRTHQGQAKTESSTPRARQSRTPALGWTDGPQAALLSLQKAAGNAAVSDLLAGGAPLPPALRRDMEQRFGCDFSTVRIHDGPGAEAATKGLSAKAVTIGSHIAFDAGRFAPDTSDGRRLIAHELAHVVQQSRGGSASPSIDGTGPLESDAARAGRAAAGGGGAIAVVGSSAVGPAADPDEEIAKQASEEEQKKQEQQTEAAEQDDEADKSQPVPALPRTLSLLSGPMCPGGCITDEELDARMEAMKDPELKKLEAEEKAQDAKRKEEEAESDRTRHDRLVAMREVYAQKKYNPEDLRDWMDKDLSMRDMMVLKKFGYNPPHGFWYFYTRSKLRTRLIDAIDAYDADWQAEHQGTEEQKESNKKADELQKLIDEDTEHFEANKRYVFQKMEDVKESGAIATGSRAVGGLLGYAFHQDWLKWSEWGATIGQLGDILLPIRAGQVARAVGGGGGGGGPSPVAPEPPAYVAPKPDVEPMPQPDPVNARAPAPEPSKQQEPPTGQTGVTPPTPAPKPPLTDPAIANAPAPVHPPSSDPAIENAPEPAPPAQLKAQDEPVRKPEPPTPAAKPPTTKKPTARPPASAPPQQAPRSKQLKAQQDAKYADNLDKRIARVRNELSEAKQRTVEYKAAQVAAGEKQKGGPSKAIWNKAEELYVLERARAHSDRNILEQVRLVGVKAADGTITAADDIAGEGRTVDFLEIDGGKVLGGEVKSKAEIVHSVEDLREPGMLGEFKDTSKVGAQRTKEQKIIDYAKEHGGNLVFEGKDVRTGAKFNVEVDLPDYRSTVVAYDQISSD
jgi:hypothetical protein